MNTKFEHLIVLFRANDYRQLKESLLKLNEADIAEFLTEIDEIEALSIFRLLPSHIASETFSYLDSDTQEMFIASMTNVETVDLVDKVYIDDMVDVIEQMPDAIVHKIMQSATKEKRAIFNEYLSYPKDSVGSIMTPSFLAINKDRTVTEVIKQYRQLTDIDESFYTIYITDDRNVLTGYVEIKDILTSPLDTKISEITYEDVISVHTLDDQEEVAKIFDKYEFLAIPVVDDHEKLVGVVTFDDAITVIHEEAEEDFQKMAAMTPSDKEYLDSSIMELSKQRFVWLLLLMISSTASQFVINGFHHVITVVTGLLAFMPMLTDSAGNAGSQSSTTIIRGLSIGELSTKNVGTILFKELQIAVIVGGGLAITNFIRIMIFGSYTWLFAVTVSLALFFTIVIAKMFGSLLPIFAQIIKVDPTIMAAPLLTTIVDSISLVIYFSIAKLLLT